MRSLALLSAFVVLSACERLGGADAPPAVEPPTPVDVIASDELPLTTPATGLAFWIHPNVAFNSVMIAANAEGLVSYNIEDGAEVARVSELNAEGVAVSYFGFGPLAAGVVATFDADDKGFRFYGVGNASRTFLSLTGGPFVDGEMNGFCFGRAPENPAPSLFVIEESGVRVFNVALGDDEGAPGIAVEGQAILETSGNIRACAVDSDGMLLVADDRGDIYRLAGDDAFAAPFARSGASNVAGLSVLMTTEGAAIALLDGADGVVQFFDRETGERIGAMRHTTRDAAFADPEGEAVAPPPPSTVLGAASANLGALYRNGVIALGVPGDAESLVRLVPLNGVQNALPLPAGAPVNPRGALPEQEDNGLLIPGLLDAD